MWDAIYHAVLSWQRTEKRLPVLGVRITSPSHTTCSATVLEEKSLGNSLRNTIAACTKTRHLMLYRVYNTATWLKVPPLKPFGPV